MTALAALDPPCPVCGSPHVRNYRIPDPYDPTDTVPAWACENPDCDWKEP